jgi:hypothetical protein
MVAAALLVLVAVVHHFSLAVEAQVALVAMAVPVAPMAPQALSLSWNGKG